MRRSLMGTSVNRLVLAGLVVLAALTGCDGDASPSKTASSDESLSATSPQPVDSTPVSVLDGTSTPQSAPDCEVGQLRLAWIGAGPAMSTFYANMNVLNVGDDCVLPPSTSMLLDTRLPHSFATLTATDGNSPLLLRQASVNLRLAIPGLCICEPPGGDGPPVCGSPSNRERALLLSIGGRSAVVPDSGVPLAAQTCPRTLLTLGRS